MKIKWSALIVPALLLACMTARADDGEKTIKEMTGGNADTVEGQVAKFRVELSSVLPGPVTLEAVCER